ncbi:uncharacterized protein J3R85_005924 [Psidium guajava]|nr:uncharacterized protein J3R85_005924 [Psidium guajava]
MRALGICSILEIWCFGLVKSATGTMFLGNDCVM